MKKYTDYIEHYLNITTDYCFDSNGKWYLYQMTIDQDVENCIKP